MEETNKQLTENEVQQVLNAWDFLEFSNSYKRTYGASTYFTPDMVNQQMKNINMNPMQATMEGLEKALNNPKDSEQILRGYAESAENQSIYYKRLLRYFPDMASFNLTFDPINIEKESELNSKEFKEDLKVLDDFCSRFNFKEEFQMVFRQMLRQGIYYGILRQDGEKYTLQELPADYCQITGRFSHGLLFDFNMYWFLGNYGVDLNMYPKIFRKMLRSTFTKKNMIKGYNPAMEVDKRDSSFVYWHQCSPIDGFWAFKMSPEIATIIPYYSALFPELSLIPVIRGLQNDKYFIEASKLLVGIIGFNKEAKSGQVANQINITPDMLGKFLGVARQGLSKQIGLVALPVEDIKTAEFDTSDKNIETDYIKNISKQSVASSEAIFTDEKLNSHQSKLASAVDANVVKSVYPMFANFVEYFVNMKTSKYKFKIKFNDVDIPDDKTDRMSKFRDMANMGMVDVQLAARIFDMNPFEFSRSLSLTKTLGIDKKIMSLANMMNNNTPIKIEESSSSSSTITSTRSNSNSNNESGLRLGRRGRPPKPDSDNDNTIASIDRGSNELKVE